MPHKKFNRRYVWRWRSGAREESENIFDLPFTWREDVEFELDSAGQLHFNVPRVIVEHSMRRWAVGTGNWAATLDFSLNILAAFICDDAAWMLHVAFAQEFLMDVSEYQVEPGRWRIRSSEIRAWLVLQAFGTGITYGEPIRVYA